MFSFESINISTSVKLLENIEMILLQSFRYNRLLTVLLVLVCVTYMITFKTDQQCNVLPNTCNRSNTSFLRSDLSVSMVEFCSWRPKMISDLSIDRNIRNHLKNPRRIYVGAGFKTQPGWESFDFPEMDLTNSMHFEKLFCPDSIGAFLSEHTYEHIPYNATIESFKLIRKCLVQGGYFRIAIPKYIRVNGSILLKQWNASYKHVNPLTSSELVSALNFVGFTNLKMLKHVDSNGTLFTYIWLGSLYG